MFENQEKKENNLYGENSENRTSETQTDFTQSNQYHYNQNAYNQNTYSQNPYGQKNFGPNINTSNDEGDGSVPPHDPNKKIREKKPKNTHPLFKKLATMAACGLGFGLFLGLGIYVVSIATGTNLLASKTAETTELETTVEEIQQTIDNLVQGGSDTDTTTLQTATTQTVVTDVTDVVDAVMPSVVSINNTYTEESYDIFGQYASGEATSTGSGIIVGQNDTELLIVTNYHVIADAETLTVQFIDETTIEAQVKGSDSDMDLAILAIPLDSISEETMSKIAIATLGDSDSLQVGEPAIAIGNALGYGQSVTVGVVSAVDRPVTIEEVTNNFIQTDAAINPGNSGGALLNISGEVIGINSNKIGGTAIEGMGYAIPISAALPIIEELMNKETLIKVDESQSSYLGIGGVDVTAELASTYSMPEGVYITQISEGTAAEQYGLEKGDVIVAFDGTEINSMADLQNLMQYYAAGTQVEITVMRISQVDYEEQVITVTLGSKN